jgi:plastocyanin
MIPMKAGRLMAGSCPELRATSAAAAFVWFAAAIAAICVQPVLADVGSTATVSLSLTKYGTVQSGDGGSMVGVRPAIVHVHVGDAVIFVNDDTDHHTATSLLGAKTFVDDPEWTDDALHAGGAIGAGFWSTGDLAPGQRSAPIVAKQPGTYLYGCFFDYGAGMRGEIVVEP